MKTTSRVSDLGEVERLRQVRRTLEQTHHELAGLCRWIESLQTHADVKKSSASSKRKPPPRARRS
jgi:hypothetical protein